MHIFNVKTHCCNSTFLMFSLHCCLQRICHHRQIALFTRNYDFLSCIVWNCHSNFVNYIGVITEKQKGMFPDMHILIPFVAVNCHVGKQVMWRTTTKETSTLQNKYNSKLLHWCSFPYLAKFTGDVMQCNNDKFREAYTAQTASRALYKKSVIKSKKR